MPLSWESGSTAEDFVADLKVETMKLGFRMADQGVDVFRHNIEINTPVETSHLRNSYKRTGVLYLPTQHEGMQVYCWTGDVYSEVEYAPYVEYGTGLWGPKKAKYKIAPKHLGGVLAFTPYARGPHGDVILNVQNGVTKAGKPVFARFVMHPGSPGQSMFRIGALLTEHEIEEWTKDALERWRAAVMT